MAERITYSSELLRALVLAVDAGAVADDATRPFVPSGGEQRSTTSSIPGHVSRRWKRRHVMLPGPDQARRSCEHLDEFAAALATVDALITDRPLRDVVETAPGWSARLWEHNRNAPAVLGEVRAATARLNRYRTQAVLGRPLSSPDDISG